LKAVYQFGSQSELAYKETRQIREIRREVEGQNAGKPTQPGNYQLRCLADPLQPTALRQLFPDARLSFLVIDAEVLVDCSKGFVGI
jgi:hypothetical protein